MTLTADPPPAEAPDAGVIEEARERQLRHRGLAAAVVLVIGAIVLASTGGGGGSRPTGAVPHRRPPAKTARLSRESCTSGKGKALQGAPSRSLLSILGVLRRPATATDALPPSIRHNIIGTGFVSDVFVRYIRRTRVVGGSPHYIYPAALSACAGNQPHVGIMDVATNVDLGHGIIGGDGGGGADAAQIERAEDAGTGPPGSPTSATVTMLVPDGVAEVTLRYPAGRASGYSPKISPPVTIETKPVENQVVVRVPRSGGGGTIRKVKMIWRASDGHVIRMFDRL
jgi:hypothetical protein